MILYVKPRKRPQEMCPRNVLEKVGSRSNTWGDLSDFCRTSQRNSFCKACSQTCHKTCAQGTFWKKWEAGSTPGGTYLIFAGSCKGAHLAGQVQKPVTRSVPKKHFGKNGGRSSTCGDLSDFCRVLKGSSFCRSGPETCYKKCA